LALQYFDGDNLTQSDDPVIPDPRRFDGSLFENGGTIYWMDMGLARAIPNPTTYAKLFMPGAWKHISTLPKLGEPIGTASELVHFEDDPLGIYFLEGNNANGILSKRVISSMPIFNKYHFNLNAVVNVTAKTSDYPVVNGPLLT